MASVALAAVLLAQPAMKEAHTEHYDIRSEAWDPELLGRLLEQLHARLSRHFGGAPPGRLVVEMYASQARFQAGIQADGGSFTAGGGGYYSIPRRKVYVYPAPTEYFTRQVVLHEATHQFHFLTATGNRLLHARWYMEGLAEFFAMHNWNGEKLATGVVPAITIEDYPAAALKEFDAHERDLGDIVAGRIEVGRPLAWSIVHFLVHNYPQEFGRLAAMLDRGENTLAAWNHLFGPVTPELVDQYRAWVLRHSQPWHHVWRQWQQWGETVEGHSDVVALAVLKNTPRRLEAELEPVQGDLKAGLAFGYQSPEDFRLLIVFGDGRAWIVRRVGRGWRYLTRTTIPEAEGRNRVALERAEDKVTVSVNGKELGAFEAAGQVGVHVDACRVRFHVKADPPIGSRPPEEPYPKPPESYVPAWRPVWQNWRRVGDALEGNSATVALAVLKRTPKRLDVQTELIGGPLKAGLVFGYRSEEDFYAVVIAAGNEAWVVRRNRDDWERILTRRVDVGATRNRLALQRDGKQIALLVNGDKLHAMEAPGRVGLICETCRVRFYIQRPPAEP